MVYAGESEDVTGASPMRQPPRLLTEVRRRLRLKHYSLRTEQAYVTWIRRFILSNGKRHPRSMGATEVERFLSDLAVHGHVAAGTQNQALSALLFLYREALHIDLPWLDDVVRAKRPQRLPVVLSQDEARRLLAAMDGRPWLIASLLHGTGMRLMECLRLRVKDIDFARHVIMVREGKVETGVMTRCVEAHRVRRARRRQEADWRCASGTNLESWFRLPGPHICRMRWHASTRAPRASSAGSSCSPRCSARSIRWMARSAGITSMTPFFRVR